MIPNNNLEEILRQKQKEEQSKPQPNWNEEKKQWVQTVYNFYKQIKKWLKPYEEQHLLTVESGETIKIKEEYIGEYSIEELVIKVPGEQIVLAPIGKMILGAHGRIDMQTNRGTIKFLLVEAEDLSKKKYKEKHKVKSTNCVWVTMTKSFGGIQYNKVDQEAFSDLLSTIING